MLYRTDLASLPDSVTVLVPCDVDGVAHAHGGAVATVVAADGDTLRACAACLATVRGDEHAPAAAILPLV